MSEQPEPEGAKRLPPLAFEALIRLDDIERRRLESITARSAQLTGSAAIVAGLAGFAVHSGGLVATVVLFVVAAALGVAAQWPKTGLGLDPHLIWGRTVGADEEATRTRLAEAIVKDIETTRSVARDRSIINRIGLCIQVAALAVLAISVAVN